MAFDTARARIVGIEKAGNVIGKLQTVQAFALDLQANLALYQAGTDAAFNAAFNALFTAADRQELAAMIGQLSTLATDWQANHAGVLNA